MTKTENYQLNQWEPADPIRRTDFNADNAAIDAALSESAKALTDYQTANDAAVAKKAEQSAVTALEQSVNSQITALAEALGTGGKTARIAWGSYTGDGTYGSTNPVTLTFDFCPMVVMIGSESNATYAENPTLLLNGASRGHTDRSVGGDVSGIQTYMTLTWTENSVSFYNPAKALYQCNYNGYVYRYVAIGYDMEASE